MGGQKSPDKEETRAVALGYDSEIMKAPHVLAAGRGYLAEKIIETAREHSIPVEKDPVLAEALAQLDPGDEIPYELYSVVAEVLVFIMETDKKLQKKLK